MREKGEDERERGWGWGPAGAVFAPADNPSVATPPLINYPPPPPAATATAADPPAILHGFSYSSRSYIVLVIT